MDIFYLKTCLLSIKAANWGTGSLQLFYSRFTTKHLLSFWTTWERDPSLILPHGALWAEAPLSWHKKFVCFSLINPQSDLWAITIWISQAWSWRIFLVSNDGTLPGARRSTRDHPRPQGHGESLPIHPEHPQPLSEASVVSPCWSKLMILCRMPKSPSQWQWTCRELTPPLWQQVLELHMSISVTSKKVFLMWFLPHSWNLQARKCSIDLTAW